MEGLGVAWKNGEGARGEGVTGEEIRGKWLKGEGRGWVEDEREEGRGGVYLITRCVLL